MGKGTRLGRSRAVSGNHKELVAEACWEIGQKGSGCWITEVQVCQDLVLWVAGATEDPWFMRDCSGAEMRKGVTPGP